RDAAAGRRASRRRRETHEAAHALRHQVVTGARRIRSVLAETRDRAVDQPRAFRREALVVEPELGEAADLEILDQHVGARRELLNDALAVRALEIGLDRALAAVGRMEI